MKIIILILHSKIDIYIKLLEKQEEYLKKFCENYNNIRYYKYYFNNNITENLIDEDTNSIIIKGEESHNPGCRIKTYEAFKMISDKDFDYIIRINESTIVDYVKLIKLLEDCKPKYAGMINRIQKNQIDHKCGLYNNNYEGRYYMSGRCIILSKDSINFINNYNKNNIDNVIDDLSIGLLIINYTNLWTDFRKFFRLVKNFNLQQGIIYMHKSNNRIKDFENISNTSNYILKKYNLI